MFSAYVDCDQPVWNEHLECNQLLFMAHVVCNQPVWNEQLECYEPVFSAYVDCNQPVWNEQLECKDLVFGAYVDCNGPVLSVYMGYNKPVFSESVMRCLLYMLIVRNLCLMPCWLFSSILNVMNRCSVWLTIRKCALYFGFNELVPSAHVSCNKLVFSVMVTVTK